MGRPYSLRFVPMLAVLLPCALIGLIGYKWVELEREAEATRGEKAAEAEAKRIRNRLAIDLAHVTGEVARSWNQVPAGGAPFAPAPRLPEIVASAFVLTPTGRLKYPDYKGAYLRAIQAYESASAPVKAATLLSQARSSLISKRYGEAESFARQILDCCPALRDEYGVSFALYAALQILAASEAQGRLREDFPLLATQLGALLRSGEIGYPTDLLEIGALTARAGSGPHAALLLDLARDHAKRIQENVEEGARLEKWVSGSFLASAPAVPFSLHTLWRGERPQLVGVYRTDDEVVVALFASGPLAVRVEFEADRSGHFQAVLAKNDEYRGSAVLRTVLLPEAPGFELSLIPRGIDPAMQKWRRRLFAAALAAAVLLVLMVGCFAFRDASREVRLASLRASFVASVTHELKTPLTSIRLLAETLQLKRVNDPAAGDEMLSAIVDESERLSRLVNNVLTFARIEKGASPYHPTPIDLTDAVCDAVRRFQWVLKQGGFSLRQESGGPRMRVFADAEALSQAMLNLLDNAVKYSGLSREILLGVYRSREEVEIRVTDHGIGLSPLEQCRIFESFYRVPAAARDTAGAGLGLALVKHFAEAHGGRVSVTSELGKGSIFSLWLPLTENNGQDPDH